MAEMKPDDVTPRPDPTLLTTEALLREVENLRNMLGARMDAMDAASDLRREIADRVPEVIRGELGHLRELHEARFATVELQFHERDVGTDKASIVADKALQAALQAARELVQAQSEAATDAAIKSETSFTKQIDQIGVQLQSVQAALDARITEMKERIDRGDGHQQGGTDSRALLFSVLGVMATVAIIISPHIK